MPKLKTRKTVSKRYRVTKTGKIIKRTAGQSHFNARESGKVGRNKKSDVIVSSRWDRAMTNAMPN